MSQDKHVGRIERLLSYRWALIVALFAFLPFSLNAAWQSWLSNSNNVEDWLPIDEQLTEFVGLFGSDELLMISWEGCSLDDPRIALYAEALQSPNSAGDVFYRDAITGPEILEFYESEPLEMDRDEALDRMGGWIVSADDATTCVIALVSYAGAADRHRAVAFARNAANNVEGLEPQSLRMAGPTIEGVAIDNASQEGLLKLNLYSYVICLTILVVCLKSLRAALLVFLLALFNEQLSLALIHYLGSNLDSILLLTANLTFVLTISVGVHLVNYYRDAVDEYDADQAPAMALRVALRPTLVATATTALGLVSLGISDVLPLSRFGLFSALSILIGTAVVMVFVPTHFRIWPMRRVSLGGGLEEPKDAVVETSALKWLPKIAVPLLLVVAATLVVGALGVKRLQTAVGLRELVSPQMQSSQDFVWLENNIGPLVPVELVLELPTGDAYELLAQFRVVHRLHEKLAEIDPGYAVISSATLSPDPPPPGGGFRQLARAAAFRRQLVSNQEELSNLGYLRLTDASNYWRITLRAPSMQDVNYGALLAEAETVVDAVLADSPKIVPKQVLVCGGIPLIYNVQQELLNDLIDSFLLAFSLVSLALMLLFRSVWCGLVCMIPNLLPSAIVFGLMGWLGWSVEVGTVLTASAALGIAVDDSLHFITWFQRALSAGKSIPQAVGSAYRRCGAAMLQTTLVCGLGLLVFAGSGFSPISRFGWCMFTLLFLALVADLVVLPAILLSPLGRLFVPADNRATSASQSAEARGALRKGIVLILIIGGSLVASETYAQTLAEQRDALARILPEKVLSLACVSDFSLAVAEQAEFPGDQQDRWGDFEKLFGISPPTLAEVSEGPLIRAKILHNLKEEQLVVVRVQENSAESLKQYIHGGVFLAATNKKIQQGVIDKIEQPQQEHATFSWQQALTQFDSKDSGELSLSWYVDPWLKDRILAQQQPKLRASKRYREAERHGLSSIEALAGTIIVVGLKAHSAEVECTVGGEWKSTLKMLKFLKPMESTELATWVPQQIESVTLLSLDLPRAFDHIDAVFDDGFAEGVAGTYRDLLTDIKQGIEVEMVEDLYADFLSRAYIIRGVPSDDRPQGFLIAVETAAPEKAAEVVFKLMDGDDQKQTIEVPGVEFPMYHVPPQSEGGEDFVMMVAHDYLFYTNDVSLMRQVLDTAAGNSLAGSLQVKQCIENASSASEEQPGVIVVRGSPSGESQNERRSTANPFVALFKGYSSVDEGDRDAPTSQLFSVVMPISDSFDCTIGYLSEDGLKFYSSTQTTTQP